MAAYSMDLRKRVLLTWDAGMDAESVAARYEVSARGSIAYCNGGATPGRSRRGSKRRFGSASWRRRKTG
jgi:hypothetical protein